MIHRPSEQNIQLGGVDMPETFNDSLAPNVTKHKIWMLKFHKRNSFNLKVKAANMTFSDFSI